MRFVLRDGIEVTGGATAVIGAALCVAAIAGFQGCGRRSLPVQHQWGFHLAAGDVWEQTHDLVLRLNGEELPLPVLVRTEAPVEVLQQDEHGLRVRFGEQLAELVVRPKPEGLGHMTHWVRDQPGRRSIQRLAFWVVSPDGSWPRTRAMAHNEMWALLPFCRVVDLDEKGAPKPASDAARAPAR